MHERTAERPRKDSILLPGIAAAAVVLRLAALGRHELWLDEANSVIMARGNIAGLFERIISDANPPLYYLLLHYWMALFGPGEFAVRLLSVLFGAGLVLLVYFVLNKYFGSRAGLFGALVCAVTPISVYCAQNARMYTLLPLASLSAVYFLIEAFEGNDRRSWAGYIVCSAAALYTHNYAVFLLPLGFAWAFFIREYRSRLKELGVSCAAVLLLYLPWVPVLLRQSVPERTAWIAQFMVPIPPLLYIPKTLQAFSAGAGYPYYFEYLGFGQNPAVSLAAGAFFVALAYFAVRVKNLPATGNTLRRRKIQFALYLFVPLLCALLVSFRKPVYLVGRYDNVVFPAFCALAALGMAGAARRFPGKIVAGALILLAAYSLLPYYRTPPRGNSRAVAGYIAGHSQAGDAVIFTGFRRATLQYYLGRVHSSADLRLFSFPQRVEKHLGIYDAATYLAEPGQLEEDARSVVAAARSGLSPGGKLWLADDPTAVAVNAVLFRQLTGFAVVKQHSSKRLGIYCLEQKG